MLVLSQRVNESTTLTLPDGTKIVVWVVDVRENGKRVRLGYDAPKEVQIVRENARNKTPRPH